MFETYRLLHMQYLQSLHSITYKIITQLYTIYYIMSIKATILYREMLYAPSIFPILYLNTRHSEEKKIKVIRSGYVHCTTRCKINGSSMILLSHSIHLRWWIYECGQNKGEINILILKSHNGCGNAVGCCCNVIGSSDE